MYVNTVVNNCAVRFLLDTGSDITLLNEKTWKKMGSPTLEKTNVVVKNASGDRMKVYGKLRCMIEMKGIKTEGYAYVTPYNSLMGLEWIRGNEEMAHHMDMMISEVKAAPNCDVEDALKKTYSEVIEEGRIEHPKIAPCHPQSNGLAERFVDTFKRGIKKLKGEEKPRTPAEVFLGRKLQTRMILLSPIGNTPRSSSAPECQIKMKEQIDRRNRVTPKKFESGDVVYTQIWKVPNFVWKTGTIVRRLGRVNYEVEVEGKLMWKHANQLRRSNAKTKPNPGDRPLKTLLEVLELNDLLKRKDEALDCKSDADTAIPCSPEPKLRRSTRTRRPLQSYGCEPLVDVVKHK
ncbi:hypothetical protein TELCIR_23680 [Teladorsagia circumcincta]|uniref:Peptidase A2 domain-containing protein n=1 Tax=Teladorsagia circumcincta TaxID=45464 RepID=A0A2G9TAH9_TELCI|nr:hypothetical protein TELCIR_23680 [Teladorsagia circumcincta]